MRRLLLAGLVLAAAACGQDQVVQPPVETPARPPSEQVTQAPADGTGPAQPPPAGERLVFASGRDGNFDIYVMNGDGSGVANLTNRDQGDGAFPVFSPDGSRIAFTGDFEGQGLYVMNADGSDLRKIVSGEAIVDNPDWSPDGSQLVFTYARPGAAAFAVTIVGADGSGLRPLTNDQEDGACDPAWSPDGRLIAYSSCQTVDDDDLFVMNADGTNPRQLTATAEREFQPAWSRDSAQLLYVSGELGREDLFLVNADGTDPRQLIAADGRDQQPAWSQDGEWIAFASDRDGEDGAVYVMRADGSSQQNLTPEGGDTPSWAP